ncbi:hypothetical protein MC885_016849 [Smutsia gigantea]|nr:hypothetical protein MC885_016849 [Smutsia gigantea]
MGGIWRKRWGVGQCFPARTSLEGLQSFASSLCSPDRLQACGDPKAKPSYVIDKNLESAVKFIVRKFPDVENRNNNVVH